MSRIVTLSAVAVTVGAWAGALLHVLSVINVTLEQQHRVSPAGVASVGHQLRHSDGLYRSGGHMVCRHCHAIQDASGRITDR